MDSLIVIYGMDNAEEMVPSICSISHLQTDNMVTPHLPMSKHIVDLIQDAHVL